ncbi:hypothetical protein Syun_030245 [Stephania yunnanensis]|uniref:Enoyl reductase (ER) domain-containing protein n=1 Tax=Stephania yunnanensis TaxID=152371 RepID=A0AAP0E772_9MAGN
MEQNKQIIFKGYIDGTPKETDMELKLGEIEVKAPKGSKSVLVKNLYLSCDPYMRGRMRENYGSYIHPFVPGSVIEGFGVCKVVESDDPFYKIGDLVVGLTGWEEYSFVRKNEQLRKIEHGHDDVPLSYHVGLLGMPGFTAYAGFYEACAPKKGDCVFVSAASGAVGQLVGQLARLHGCYVVEPLVLVRRCFPQGIDIYFDNVGGAMLDAALLNMKVHGRIAVCGMVSQQSISNRDGIHNLFTLISKRIKMQGFLQSDYLHLFPQFLEHVLREYKQGNIVYIEDLNEGLESAPAALVGLFSGKNVGKQVVCIAKD